MVCPLCSYVHTLKDESCLPPVDLLLKFMVEASTEEKAQCANCDCSSVQMFFCNTCMQPLCSQCREDTHRAKMFSSHDMVLLTKRAREVHKKCKIHEEPYIMFSNEKKIMLCINCFRDMRIESRGHCLDLETAYKQSCKKLDLKVQAFRELQNSVREGILLFRGLVEEIKTNAAKERNSIVDLYSNLIQRLDETRLMLLQKVDNQYTEKETAFRSQLRALSALVPTLHTHLVISSAFSGSANKFEFLDLSYVLMERLKSIVQKQHPLHATLSGQIDSSYKSEYLKSIEPLLYVPAQRTTRSTAASVGNGIAAVSTGTSCPGSPVTSKITPTHQRRSNGLNGAKVKFIDAKGQFAEHCCEFESAHRDLLQKFDLMKSQCQELQRDLTMRRCLAKRDMVLQLGQKIEDVQTSLDKHYSTLESKLPLLEKHWEESLDRIMNEQDLYQAQLQDVMRLKQESQHLRLITSQLVSFVSSIAAVTERLAPKLGQSTQMSDQENQMASLLDEINAVQPDSQLRVDAIRGAEEERLTQIANRTNPLDDELIKTKGLLRCPSLRSIKGERRKSKQDKESQAASAASDKEFSVSNGDQLLPPTSSTSFSNLLPDSSVSSPPHPLSTATKEPPTVAVTSTLLCAEEKVATVVARDKGNFPGETLSNGLWPSPTISLNQFSDGADIKGSAQAACNSSSSVLMSNGIDTAINVEGTCIVPTRNHEKRLSSDAQNVNSGKSSDPRLTKEPDIDSYVTLATQEEYTMKYIAKESSNTRADCRDKSPMSFVQSLNSAEAESPRKPSKLLSNSTEKEKNAGDARKELLKDVENFNRKESLTSPGKLLGLKRDNT